MKKGCLVALVLAIFLAAGAVLFGPRLVEAGMKFLYPQRYAGLVEREAPSSSWTRTWSTPSLRRRAVLIPRRSPLPAPRG